MKPYYVVMYNPANKDSRPECLTTDLTLVDAVAFYEKMVTDNPFAPGLFTIEEF